MTFAIDWAFSIRSLSDLPLTLLLLLLLLQQRRRRLLLLMVVVVVFFFRAYEDFGGRFDESIPICTFFLNGDKLVHTESTL